MNIVVWNVKGFNHPIKQKEIVNRLNTIKLTLVCLSETKVKRNKMFSIVQRRFENWKFLPNYDFAYNGHIWLLWKGFLQVDIVFVNNQCITVTVVFGSAKIFFSYIYGLNTGGERKSLWRYLESIIEAVVILFGCLLVTLMSLAVQIRVYLFVIIILTLLTSMMQ